LSSTGTKPANCWKETGDCSGKDLTLSATGNDSTSEDMNSEVAKIVAIKKIHGWGNMVQWLSKCSEKCGEKNE